MMTGRSERARIQRQISSPPGRAGEHDIQHDDVDILGLQESVRLLSVARFDRAEAFAFQVATHDVADDRLVVDDQDFRGDGGAHGVRMSSGHVTCDSSSVAHAHFGVVSASPVTAHGAEHR
jgi:hypothetical protein